MATISSRDKHLVAAADFDALWERLVTELRAGGLLDEDTIAYAKLDDLKQALARAAVVPRSGR